WVNGTLKRSFAAGAFSGTLDVGDATEYAPIAIAGTGAGAGFNLTAISTPGEHPNLPSSAIDTARCVHRRWLLSPATAAGATWSATFNFASGEVDAGATPAAFIGQVWSGSAWASLTMGALGATSTQVTGLTAATPGTVFVLGNLVSRALAVNLVGGGSVTRSPDQPGYASGSTVQLTAVPGAGWAFSAWSGAL